METRKIKRDETDISVMRDDLSRLTTEYLNTKSMSDKVNARMTEIKKALSSATDTMGQADEKGNLWLPLGNNQLKREKRVSTSFDADAAAAWAKEQGLWDSVKIVVETLDVDKLLALAWENREYSSVVESFNKETITWAFKVVEKKAYDDDGS